MNLHSSSLLPLIVTVCLGAGLPQVVSAQSKPGPGGLFVLNDKTFAEWMTGTKWECTINGALQRFWFASPGLVFYERPGRSDVGVGAVVPYTIEKKGMVIWSAPGEAERIYRITFAADLGSASLVDVGSKASYPVKALEREGMPEVKMTEAEYKTWLTEHAITFPEAKYTFGEEGTVTVTTPKDQTTHPFVVAQPGLVRIHWQGKRTDPTVLFASPERGKARMWVWWGYKEGNVEGGAEELAQEEMRPGEKAARKEIAQDNALPAITVKLNSTSVNALLIRELGGGKLAGSASALSLTSLPGGGDSSGEVKFNQNVGDMMQKALKEVSRFHALRQNGWPRGVEMELSFADKFTPKDGPSAAVACALLLESAFTGTKLDSGFAVTGDMNADGSVQPIGGVHAKLRGATKLSCKLLGIPEKNAAHAADIALTEGIKPFIAIQVFSLTKFEDALTLARTDKPAALAAAIAEYDVIAQVLQKNPTASKSPSLPGKLKAILEKAPNHFSAKILLEYATGKMPVRLSPAGTLSELRQGVGDIVTGINGDMSATSKLDGAQLGKARGALQRLRPLADLRVRSVVDAYVDWATLAAYIIYEDEGLITKQTIGRWQAAVARIKTEEEKLRKDESFSEDLE